ncbi:MAG: hypothetical protein A2Y17_09005 [Clostridiales bacterium GWF2_38_85]|nr:MAG: hypothetical protein A2Y17_09005 [Clostridiales bacterium GWF2_38_85]HBL83665.1 hypothetical protein [Clostridiales bacterium]
MKKFLTIFVAILMVFAMLTTASAKDPFAAINVPQCTTAPVTDGTIGVGEYKLIASYDAGSALWSRDSLGLEEEDVTLDFYATWDADYFYYAVKVTCLDETHPAGPNNYVFEQPSIMTAMVYDDPTLDVFASADGSDWDWGDAYACTFAREWTIGRTGDGTELAAGPCNHFGTVRSDANFKWEAACADGYDVYELAIPWSAIAKTEGIEVGGKCGLAFSCVAKSAATDYDGGIIAFASGIVGGKSFDRYAQVTLTANEPFVDEEESTPAEESDTTTIPTGDNMAIFAIIAVIALAGAVIVVSKVRR